MKNWNAFSRWQKNFECRDWWRSKKFYLSLFFWFFSSSSLLWSLTWDAESSTSESFVSHTSCVLSPLLSFAKKLKYQKRSPIFERHTPCRVMRCDTCGCLLLSKLKNNFNSLSWLVVVSFWPRLRRMFSLESLKVDLSIGLACFVWLWSECFTQITNYAKNRLYMFGYVWRYQSYAPE